MKWEERWSYDTKTFKSKVVKVRNRRKRYYDGAFIWDGAGGKTYAEGARVFNDESAAQAAGIAAAKETLDFVEKSSSRCRDDIAKANAQIATNDAEAARIKKLLAQMEVQP